MPYSCNRNKIIKTFLLSISASLILPFPHNQINAETPTKFQSKTIEKPEEGSQRVLITYKDDTSEKEKQEVENSGEVQQEFENINAISIEIPNKEINTIKNDPNVKSVEEDIVLKVNLFNGRLPEQIITYPIIDLNAKEAWDSGLTGTGVKVAVIDSGVSRHSDLIIAGGESFVDYTKSYYDDNGHGTHVAGIISAESNTIGIKGIAPDSRIYALKALDSKGEGFLSEIIAAIDWSIENDMDIINMSLGSTEDSPLFKQAVDKAYNNGILVVAAAGNDGKVGVNYPAKYSSVIGVSATNSARQLADFSNAGPEVEVAAPGVDVISLYPDLYYQYEMMSGTSMSTPFVTGILALWKQHLPNASTSVIRTKLQQNVIDLGAPGRDNNFGFGLVQAPTSTDKPAIPTNFKASKVTSTSVNLSWDHTQGATKYTLYRNNTKIYEGTDISFSDNALTPYTFYNYRLFASNGSISSVNPATTGITSLPLAPPTPLNFTSKNITSNSITLNWNSSQYATYYQLKRNGAVIYKGNQLSFVDKNLKQNTTYKYELIAGNYAKYSSPTPITSKTSKEIIKPTLNSYVFSTYKSYKRGSKVYIGVYSRHNGDVTVPWARFDLTVTGPKGLIYKTTKYTDKDGRYIISLPTYYNYPKGIYTVKVIMSKADFTNISKATTFTLN